jgi:hypothetical protein
MKQSVKALCNRWVTAKDYIKSMQDELLEIESQLFDLVESVEDGSKVNHLDGYKITVKRPINRTINGEAWEQARDLIPAEMWPIKQKIEPDTAGCKWLAENRPELWLIASKAITEKPGKAGFSIEAEAEKC